jgi:hypothetical protein
MLVKCAPPAARTQENMQQNLAIFALQNLASVESAKTLLFFAPAPERIWIHTQSGVIIPLLGFITQRGSHHSII